MHHRFLIATALWLAAATTLPAQAPTYTIRTVAGNFLLVNGGPATGALLQAPDRMSTDLTGNIYIAQLSGLVRRIDLNGIITTFAGGATAAGNGDGGPATQASLNVAYGFAFDSSNLYTVEFQACDIRRINFQTGIISTIAGTGVCEIDPDGPAATTSLYYPDSLAIDSQGRLIVAERVGNRIRRIQNGTVTTIAGNGTAGLAGDGGPASKALVTAPAGLTLDSKGDIFFTDLTNCLVRMIDAGSGNIRTIAGSACGSAGDNGPALSALLTPSDGLLVNSAGTLLYASDINRVREINLNTQIITTYAGVGIAGDTGDGGPANQAELNGPGDLAFDQNGNLLVLDSNYVRRIDSHGIITTIAGANPAGGDGGPATSASLLNPNFPAPDERGGFAIADASNGRIRVVSPNGVISTLAGGNPSGSGIGDGGPAKDATVGFITGMVYDAVGNLYFTEGFTSNELRRISPSGQIDHVGTTIFAATAGMALDPTQQFAYISEQQGNRIVRVNLSTGAATTFAGAGSPGAPGTAGFGGDGGPASKALFSAPGQIAVDGAGNVYVTDTTNARIRRISPSGDSIQTVAGNGGPGSTGEGGLATAAAVNNFGLAADAAGNLFVSEGAKIRRVDAHSGIISTIAGSSTSGFKGDGGSALSALLNNLPIGVNVDSQGNVYLG